VIKKYDVIIIGAGPAGSSAAYLLANKGFKVVLIDKSKFPRDKLCAGGLSGRSKKVFEDIFGSPWDKEIIEYKSHGLAFYHKDKYLNKLDDYKPIHFIYRVDFDYYLAQKAEQAGADFVQGFDIAELDGQTNTVTGREGDQYQATYLIGADGVRSIVAKKLLSQPFDKNRYAIAMEAEIDRKDFARSVDVPEIYCGSIKWGYGWIFPKKDRLTVGIVGLYKYNPNIKKVFQDFLENDLGLSADIDMKGYYLPFGRYSKKPGKGSKLLVGDAAGLVDPVTGEGIAFAMQSGQFAAQSIIEAQNINDPESAYRFYKKKLKKITRTLSHANFVKHLIYPEFSMRLLVKGLASSRDKYSIKYYIDLLADDISYPQYIGRLIRKSGKRIFKLLVT